MWVQKMRTLFLIFIALLILGCSSVKVYELKPHTKLFSPNIAIKVPSSYLKTPWETFDTPAEVGVKDGFYLWRQLPNMMREKVKIMVSVPTEDYNINFLLDKKKSDDLERTRALPPSEWEKKNLKERRVGYNKHYVDYIAGLKCTSNVESSNIVQGVGYTKYYTVCGYHNTTGEKKRINIFYDYVYTHDGTKFESDSSNSIYSPQAMKKQFKEDMKAIFDSLIIHDMDREKMKKDGLLYDKKYQIDTEDGVPNSIGK